MDLKVLQDEVGEWAYDNFGTCQGDHLSLLGAMEELGELSHAHLKGVQGIRHSRENIHLLKVDAVGDIIIYLANYCATEGINMEDAVSTTWAKVSQRKWKT